MEFTPELDEKILDALKQRLPDGALGACPICGTQKWLMGKVFALLPAVPDLQTTQSEERPNLKKGLKKGGRGRSLPSIVLVCTNCGNTHFLNIRILGLDHLFLDRTEDTDAESEAVEIGPPPSE